MTPDMPLHLRQYGDGATQVLGLHCALASGRVLQGLAAALPDSTWHVPDLPGHGRSPDWPDETALDFHGHCADCMVGILQNTGPAHLFGHSYGATIALRVALDHPELVQSLTLVEPVLFAALRGTEAYTQVIAGTTGFEQALAAGDRLGAAQDFYTMWGGGGIPWEMLPAPVRDSWCQRIHLIQAQAPGLHDDTGGILLPGRLEGLAVPVALVEGADSPEVISGILDQLERRMVTSSRHRIAGAGHMVPLTHGPKVAQVMAEVIARSAAEAG
ncbi:MAG: alpha/beta hydrolase [Oceanicola sp.]|nr:alpha/beta hydrolase [Oceanicola sp.]